MPNSAAKNNNNNSSSLNDVSEIPLPKGWDVGRDFDGKIYYIDHNNKKTTWRDPRIYKNISSYDK